MIKFFYMLTFARRHYGSNRFYKLINILIYLEYLIVNKLCNFYVQNFYKKCKKSLNCDLRKEKIIVSCTSIPSRLNTLPIMLKSIFNQTMMPDKIILWITDEECATGNVERILKTEIEQGLEIRYVRDLKVHTKYYYAMKEYCEDVIITIDDDILYPENLIEELWYAHLAIPHAIISERAHAITFNNDKINPYKLWHMLAPGYENDASTLIATGVGGVLYPPKVLFKDWDNINLFLDICPTADDIWLKIMETLNGVNIHKIHLYTKENFIIGNTQAIALSKQNVNGGRNDKLLDNCIRHYGITSAMLGKNTSDCKG